MPLHTVQQIWSALGWTMIHLAWMGALYYLAAASGRRLLARRPIHQRYLYSLAALSGLMVLAIGVFAVVFSNGDHLAGRGGAGVLGFSSVVLWALPAVWLFGAVVMLAVSWTGVWGGRRLRRSCDLHLEGELADRCRRLAKSLGVVSKVGVGVCNSLASPILVGVARPLILLPPAALSNWTVAELEFVLLHELAHVRRWDNLINLLQRLVESLLFFHPAVWLVSNWVRQDRELCCDELVMTHTGRPFEYAQTLVALATAGAGEHGWGASFGRRDVAARIRYILTREYETMKPSQQAWGWMLLGAAAVAASLMWFGGQTPSQADDPLQQADLLQGKAVFGGQPSSAPTAAREKSSSPQPRNKQPAKEQLAIEKPYVLPSLPDPAIFEKPIGGILISSQTREGLRNWGPEQAVGEPNTFEAGDIPTAWASQSPDGQREWLILEYENAVRPKSVVIHETYNPGAVDKITVFDGAGKEIEVWSGVDPTPRDSEKGVSVIPVKTMFETKKIKLYIDSPSVPGWNEIDAVGLRDADGKTQWAKKATASTTYAVNVPAATPVVVTPAQLQRFLKLEEEVKKLKQELAQERTGMKQLRQEVEALKKMIEERK